jgi:hypothetical protein|tara:strand:- start:607 stop:912 length:306 start_codon:yes stop_codon:yes gene_type:complete
MIDFLAFSFFFWGAVFVLGGYFIDYFAKKSREIHEEFDEWVKLKEQDEIQEQEEAGDYWDGEDIDYDTGEIGANTRASVRHPKNRDRAYSGSVERFHDGGW